MRTVVQGCAVATVDAEGRPDVRTVLMRGLHERGPAFYTNTDSTKGRQLRANPSVAATLTWAGLHRAVRFRGLAEPLPPEEVRPLRRRLDELLNRDLRQSFDQ